MSSFTGAINQAESELNRARALHSLGTPGYDQAKLDALEMNVARLMDKEAGEILENFQETRLSEWQAHIGDCEICRKAMEAFYAEDNHNIRLCQQGASLLKLFMKDEDSSIRCSVCGKLLHGTERGKCRAHK